MNSDTTSHINIPDSLDTIIDDIMRISIIQAQLFSHFETDKDFCNVDIPEDVIGKIELITQMVEDIKKSGLRLLRIIG